MIDKNEKLNNAAKIVAKARDEGILTPDVLKKSQKIKEIKLRCSTRLDIKIKILKDKTKMSMKSCLQALHDSKGDLKQALKILQKSNIPDKYIDRDEEADLIINEDQILNRHSDTDVGRIIQYISYTKGYDITIKQGIEIWEAYSKWMMGSFVVFDFENLESVWDVIEPYFIKMVDKDDFEYYRGLQESNNDYNIQVNIKAKKPAFATRAMSIINDSQIQKLRYATGNPLMKCKQAFKEAGENYDKALELLRTDERFSGIVKLEYNKGVKDE